jgi:hypothetical protein
MEKVFPCLDFVDLVLVMSVHPGFCDRLLLKIHWENWNYSPKNHTIKIESNSDSDSDSDSGVHLANARFCNQKVPIFLWPVLRFLKHQIVKNLSSKLNLNKVFFDLLPEESRTIEIILNEKEQTHWTIERNDTKCQLYGHFEGNFQNSWRNLQKQILLLADKMLIHEMV